MRLGQLTVAAGALLLTISVAWALGPRNPRNNLPGNLHVSPSDQATAPAPDAGLTAPPAEPGDRGAGEPKQRGVALGLFAEDVSFSYLPLLREIAALGATHVALVVPIYQADIHATSLALHTRFSPTLALLADTIRAAERERLQVTIFPIVRLLHAEPGQWRGTLAPANPGRWFRSYGDVLGDLAALGAQTGASRLVVGSELSSLDGDLAHWRPLLERIRALFPGRLVYSANWDHYEQARLYELVDEEGIAAYFNLREERGPTADSALEAGWQRHKEALGRWHAGRSRPLVFTEVGYRSRAGSTAAPWDETSGGAVELEEQRRGFAAFRRAWAKTGWLDGIYVWNWYGWGGPGSRGYTPRGKPAADEVRRLLQDL